MWAISASPLVFTATIMNCSAPPPPPHPTCDLSLVTQLSLKTCTRDVNFGCVSNVAEMWVADGCRGVFACDGMNVTCDAMGGGNNTCACAPPSPDVTCTPWLSPLQQEILLNTEILAVNQDVTPQGRPVAGANPAAGAWARALSDGSVGVALFNGLDAPASLSVDFGACGWPAGTAADVRDLWAHADLGVFTGRYPASGGVPVAPHATRMLRVTKA